MSVKRIIPCLDVKDGRVVKGVQFVAAARRRRSGRAGGGLRRAPAPTSSASSTSPRRTSGATIIYDVVARTAEQVFMPLTVGGGVRSVEDVRRLLLAGADKVAINTPRSSDPELITRAAERFGAQAIVVAIDARKTRTGGETGWEVYVHGGRTATGLDAIGWAARVAKAGAGELLVTSMDRDGTRAGYDLGAHARHRRSRRRAGDRLGRRGHARAPARRARRGARRRGAGGVDLPLRRLLDRATPRSTCRSSACRCGRRRGWHER